MNKTFFLFFLILINTALPQTSNQPSIGYVYPAGGQKGTTLEIIVGGQNIRGARNAYFSTEKIKVLSITPVPSLSPQQKQLLIRNLRAIVTSWYRKDNKKPEIVYEKDGVKIPKHPLLQNLEDKTYDEIKNIIEIFLMPFNPLQVKRSIQEKVLLKIEISPDTEPGIYELRIQTFAGLTNFLKFYVNDVKEVREKEKISQFSIFNPQKEVFELPVIINGQIFPGDVDRFYFNAKRGQKLLIELKGREIIPFMADAVPGWFQGILTLYNSKGEQLVFADDYFHNPDPVIFYEVKEDGEYIIEVRDAIYRGREDFVYRLFIGEKPFITHIFPSGGERYEEATVNIYGWNLPKKTIELNTYQPGIYSEILNFNGVYSNQINYMINEIPEIIEKEPNDNLKNANMIIIPQIINGIISKKGDVDIYKFRGRKGNKIAIEVFSRRINYPLDSKITLMDSNGKTLTSNDDFYDKSFDLITHHADSYIIFELPKDDIYYIKILDTQLNGGENYIYRIRVEKANPDFKIFIVPSSINIPISGTALFYVYVVKKDGFDEEIEITLKDAPSGLTLSGNKIPKGKDKICMTITAEPTFTYLNKPVPIKIEGIANIGGKIIKREAIPADEMMQAFAYFHLVPSCQLLTFFTRGGRFSKGQLISLNEKNIKIPSGGTTKIEGKILNYSPNEKITIELKDPPNGISIEDFKIENDLISFTIKANEKLKKGTSDNLIIEVFSEPNEQSSTKKQKTSLGILPAISFEII
ncbi:MAG: PPC domain-containing protein [Candidatus Omnitrophica bacterium]|nr:PPC domain-containing protein [Candidatus Omnitrophota bacterium]MCM8802157.1 PPC domain-containing protein [Candidatus Omnitrophota bacterium]